MQLDLTRIKQPRFHMARSFEPPEAAMEGDAYRIVAPVRLTLDVHKDRDRFRLVGAIETVLELSCSRCLEPYVLPVELTFDQRYFPQSEAAIEGEVEVADEDLEVGYYRDDRIDLNELLREQFYLALPMKPLCSEECRGLCPQCGTNLNTGTCGCSPAWEDPRLAPLRQLGKSREM